MESAESGSYYSLAAISCLFDFVSLRAHSTVWPRFCSICAWPSTDAIFLSRLHADSVKRFSAARRKVSVRVSTVSLALCARVVIISGWQTLALNGFRTFRSNCVESAATFRQAIVQPSSKCALRARAAKNPHTHATRTRIVQNTVAI